MELKASWSLLIRGINSSIPRFPMAAAGLGSARLAKCSGYFQSEFHPLITFCHQSVTENTQLQSFTMKHASLCAFKQVNLAATNQQTNSQNKITSSTSDQTTSDPLPVTLSPAPCQPNTLTHDWSFRMLPGLFLSSHWLSPVSKPRREQYDWSSELPISF